MNASDPFTYDAAAYVLGALRDEELAAFERHLQHCPDCTARVHEVAALPGLLALASADDLLAIDTGTASETDAAVPSDAPTLADVRTKRRRWLAAGIAGLAAACAAVFIAVTTLTGPPTTAAPQAMRPVIPSPVHATVALAAEPWGTKITLVCGYQRGKPAYADWTYGLTVVDARGHDHRLGSWTLRGSGEVTFTSGIALRRAGISRVEITAPGGQPILALQPS